MSVKQYMGKRSVMAKAMALALIIAPQAYAQEGEAEQKNNASQEDQLVVTASGFKQNKKYAPASISVIDHKALEKQNSRDVAEAVQDISGVSVSNGAGTEVSGDVMIRGMDSSYTSFMVNSIKQNTGESRPYGQNVGTEAGFLPPLAAIDRIEVIRGPMSSLYGSDSIGGVVNVITKKPFGVREWMGSIAANSFLQQHQEFGNTQQTNLFLMGPLIPDVLGLSLSADYLDRREDEKPNSFSKNNKKSLDMTLGFAANETNLFDLNLVKGEKKRSRTEKGGGTPWGWDFDRDALSLTHSGWYAEDSIATTSYFQYEKGESTFHTSTLAPQHIQTENYVLNSQAKLSLGEHNLTLGANYSRETLNDDFYADNKRAPGIDPVTKISRDGWALFAEGQWNIEDFSLTTSARMDRDNYFGTHISPKLYGNWILDSAWALKGGVSSGYKKPSLRENSDQFITPRGSNPPYPYLSVGNSELKPETSLNTELGLYWNNNRDLSFDGTVFYTDFKDKIAEVNICEASANHPCVVNGYNAESIDKYFNIGKANVYGVELNADWQATDSLNLSANYTFNKSEQKNGVNKGYALNDFPKHMANLSAKWAAASALDVWSKVNYRSRNEETGDHTRYGAYALLDAGVIYHFDKHTQVMAGVYNIFDSAPKRTTSWGEYPQLEGRRYNLGLRVDF
ncbi:TonB-dependent receptor [Serratia proteamaculans]|uniref:TonB-dependent receptor domain-containing protein n=1 Tax=Serratia proteamaculans TaxID=28151 RepID=UPI0039B0D87D